MVLLAARPATDAMRRAAGVLMRSVATAAPSATGDAGGTYDVVVVGGGMVGAALVSLLARDPLTAALRVALLDIKPQGLEWRLPAVPDMRVSTITPASIGCLQKAGAWDALAPPAGGASFTTMQVWDTGNPGFVRWSSSDVGRQDMGIVVENNLLQAALLASAQRHGKHTQFVWPADVAALRLPGQGPPVAPWSSSAPHSSGSGSRTAGQAGLGGPGNHEASASNASSSGSGSPSGSPGASTGSKDAVPAGGLAEVVLRDGRVLRCRLVVAADGSNSRVRQLAGFRTYGWQYGQRGLVATVATDAPNTTAWQRFLPTGPLALLPVRAGFSNVVWSTTPDMAQQLERMSPEQFAAAANYALRDAGTGPMTPGAASTWAGLPALVAQDRFELPPHITGWVGSAPKSFPLQLKQAGRYVAPRLALIGDAAHTVHPLAGQGVNLGLGDAEALAAAIALAKRTGADVGDTGLLQEHYEAPRQRANLAMVAALDGVKRTFAAPGPVAGLVRSLGLGLLNAAGPVKNNIMRFAMGLPVAGL